MKNHFREKNFFHFFVYVKSYLFPALLDFWPYPTTRFDMWRTLCQVIVVQFCGGTPNPSSALRYHVVVQSYSVHKVGEHVLSGEKKTASIITVQKNDFPACTCLYVLGRRVVWWLSARYTHTTLRLAVLSTYLDVGWRIHVFYTVRGCVGIKFCGNWSLVVNEFQ